jgi:hypothetical protein
LPARINTFNSKIRTQPTEPKSLNVADDYDDDDDDDDDD